MRPSNRVFVPAGLLLGAGLGGFVDGIVLHQILQWHHLLTARDRYSRYPEVTVNDLEVNTVWDGVFHAGTWLATVAGLWLLYRAYRTGPVSGSELAGLLLAGWGMFNLVEGTLSHHVLGLHHVRDDVVEPLPWDLGFLVLGALLVAGGWVLWRAASAPRG
jgi:uncharacterized membrane protein